MLNSVISFALHYRMLVVLTALAALVFGGYVTATLPIDVFPDLDRPRVVVMTEAPGLAPEEVETLVTFPLESAFLGATGVQDVRSTSGLGLSVIYVEFDWGTNIQVARQTVQERLTTTQGFMPEGVRPQLAPISSIMGQIMIVGMHRRQGPKGGELAPVGVNGVFAELVHDPEQGSVTMRLWDTKERGRLDKWQPIKTDGNTAALTWEVAESAATLGEAGQGGNLEPKSRSRKVVLRSSDDATTLAAQSDLLKSVQNQPGFFEAARKAAISIGGREHQIVFPPPARRQMDLRTNADWVVRPRLLKVAGIAQVMVMGGGRKQYQVLVNPTALLSHDVSLQQVEQALKDNNVNASGGYAVRSGKEQPIRILGRLGPRPETVIAEIEQIPVKTTAQRTVLLKQVARVVEGPQFKRGDAGINGHPGVVLTITKQPHVDTRDLTERVAVALQELEPSLPADVVVNAELYRLREFIDRGVYNVGEALVIGAVLVLIILFLFLLNFRTTFISLTAIPLALVITGLVFKATGWITGTTLSINVMTLGGIAVALGELVDDAVVDVENIFRRLKENNALPVPRSAMRVIFEASIEVRSAIVFGTAVVVMVFIPLFALGGIEGRLFAPLGVAYIVSILASLLVSLTVTPVLSYYLLPQSSAAHSEKDSPLLRFMKWGASYLIRFSMAHAILILATTWVIVGISLWQMTRLGADFLPPFNEGSIQLNVSLPPGSPLESSIEVAAVVDAKLREMQKSDSNPDGPILQFTRRTGRAELDEHAEPVSSNEYIVALNSAVGHDRSAVIKDIREGVMGVVAGVDVEVEQPLQHLISHMISGVTAQIAIKIHGDDLDALRRVATQIKGAVQGIEGITPPVIEPQRMIDELHIRLRPDRLAMYGVSRATVADFLSVALKGEEVSQVIEGQRRFDLVVRLDEPFRTDYANLARLRIDLPGNRGPVALGELAYVSEGAGANLVNRENVRRRIVIRVNAQGRDLASVVKDIERQVDERVRPSLPEGYFIEYGGQFESQRRATNLISVLALGSFVGMFAVLYMLYPSTRIVLQILNALPAAFIGGVFALVFTRQTLTVASLVGFISLGGIAVRNGILLVTHYFHLMRYENEPFSQAMVLRGSLERLSPVLMTALTAGIGLVPLVYEGQAPGREILYPVATVILGGLITSTLCEFLLHPGLFWRFSGRDAEHLAQITDDQDELSQAGSIQGPAVH
jgi:CzcA family heavy metal efflux pump